MPDQNENAPKDHVENDPSVAPLGVHSSCCESHAKVKSYLNHICIHTTRLTRRSIFRADKLVILIGFSLEYSTHYLAKVCRIEWPSFVQILRLTRVRWHWLFQQALGLQVVRYVPMQSSPHKFRSHRMIYLGNPESPRRLGSVGYFRKVVCSVILLMLVYHERSVAACSGNASGED